MPTWALWAKIVEAAPPPKLPPKISSAQSSGRHVLTLGGGGGPRCIIPQHSSIKAGGAGVCSRLWGGWRTQLVKNCKLGGGGKPAPKQGCRQNDLFPAPKISQKWAEKITPPKSTQNAFWDILGKCHCSLGQLGWCPTLCSTVSRHALLPTIPLAPLPAGGKPNLYTLPLLAEKCPCSGRERALLGMPPSEFSKFLPCFQRKLLTFRGALLFSHRALKRKKKLHSICSIVKL